MAMPSCKRRKEHGLPGSESTGSGFGDQPASATVQIASPSSGNKVKDVMIRGM